MGAHLWMTERAVLYSMAEREKEGVQEAGNQTRLLGCEHVTRQIVLLEKRAF